jgi:regulatory helix-turn-helix LysR family protein
MTDRAVGGDGRAGEAAGGSAVMRAAAREAPGAAGVPAPARGPLAYRVPDFGEMELLLAVARLGSLGRAARELGISQPAASGRLRALETRLGVALVRRAVTGSRAAGRPGW